MKSVKKILAFSLILVICLTAIPFTALTASADTVKIGYISGENINIRKDASTSSEKVATVTKWTVNVLDGKYDTASAVNPATNAVYVWYLVSYISESKTITGYVREDLISVADYVVDPAFEATLSAFPESYRNQLTILHALYPNWEFKPDVVEKGFKDSVALQDTGFRKLVTTKFNSLRSMRDGCYNWEKEKFITSDNSKYGASTEVISYYMDPRNFLNANDIYIFMQQSFDSNSQTKDGVKKIINGTFLDAKITNKKDDYYDKTFATVIMKAAKESKVNPYVLASTLIQEQGRNGSTLSKGIKHKYTEDGKEKEKTVYNFFNFGASGSNKDAILKNGAKYAYEQGWTTPSKALIEGAKKYGSGYIAIGQDTYYYKNYNVLNPKNVWHQYAQSVHDSLSSSRFLKTCYADYKDLKAIFRIPVYNDLPKKICAFPEENNNYNNYYFTSIVVDGLTPEFNIYNNNYTLSTAGNIDVFIKLPEGALFTGTRTHTLTKGENKIPLPVMSQTGYSRTYYITVTAENDAVLTVKQLDGTLMQEADGNYYYYINGERAYDTTLVYYNNVYFYVNNGVLTRETTLVNYLNKPYYVVDGIWTKMTGFVNFNNQNYYIKDGIGTYDTKFVTLDGKSYYIKNGIQSNKTGFVKYKEKTYYIENGINTKKTGFIKHNKKVYYVKNGVRSTKTGFVEYKNKYYRLKKGVRTTSDTFKKCGKAYLKLSTSSFTYTGKSRKPSVKVYTSKGETISSKYYTASYAYGRKYVGKYKVTVRFKGKYKGTQKLYFTITPNETKVSKLTAKKKALTVKIKKQSTQTKGYELQYSTSESFKPAKTKIVSNYKTTSVKLKKLNANTTYYVRVRTYKTVSGKKYYSAWSPYKKRKTK